MRDELLFNSVISDYGIDSLIKNAELVITAFSGGADSSCLLFLMDKLCRKSGVAHVAAHVNHMIRGKEADSDEMFCRSVCEKSGIPLYVLKADVPSIAKSTKKGLEETARNIRYEFFDDISEKITGHRDRAVIATAHNASDNLETVIFNILRGCGTNGVCGIDPVRDGRYIRPLIKASGEDIRIWCKNNEIDFVVDSTNNDVDYTRNHIRHNIVPQLTKICTSPEKAVSKMSSIIRRDNDYLEKVAADSIPSGCTSVEKSKIRSLHPAILSRVLRIMYENASGSRSIEETHIRSAIDLISSKTSDCSLSLPENIFFVMDRNTVSFTRETKTIRAATEESKAVFTYPDNGDFFENEMYFISFSPDKHLSHKLNKNNVENIYKLSIRCTLCFDKIKGALRIRYRNAGDVYRFGKMSRKVKKLFNDKKMTLSEKNMIPILFDDDGIVWIPGFPPRDGLTYSGNEYTPLHIVCGIKNNI